MLTSMLHLISCNLEFFKFLELQFAHDLEFGIDIPSNKSEPLIF
jgi:hypothetical protein